MPLVYVPDERRFFLWGSDATARALDDAPLEPAKTELVAPGGRPSARGHLRRRPVEGHALPLLAAVERLAVLSAAEMRALPDSLAAWTLASKLALDLVARERVVPTVRRNGTLRAEWRVALSAAEDAAHVLAVAHSMPPAAHAVPVPGGEAAEVWAADALLRAFLDAVADALIRSVATPWTGVSALEHQPPSAAVAGARRRHSRTAAAAVRRREPAAADFVPWEARWRNALASADGAFATHGFGERSLVDDLEAWSRPALGERDVLRACFRLELPANDGEEFALRFLLQSPDDPSLLIAAEEIWSTRGRELAKLGRAFRDPQESLLEALGRAARVFAPIGASLAEARPESLALDASAAWAFLTDGAGALGEAGFGVIVPAELTASGRRRLRLRMRIGGGTKTAGAVAGAAGFGMADLLTFRWEAAIGDAALTARELGALAKQKAPLVRHRGQWVAVDPRELAEIRERLTEHSGHIAASAALAAGLAGEMQHDGGSVAVTAAGDFAELLDRLRAGADAQTAAAEPHALRGTLRPYQCRGVAWLAALAKLGLGACLADDMGLGKTVQLLAFLLHRLEIAPRDERPALLVAPTSVIGNWERETLRFAPTLHVVRHYGAERARAAADVPRMPGTLVLTTYGLLRRDAELLFGVEWSVVTLDEAQNIKNAASRTARAARSLRAAHRFALTGTPVENRLAELWSILEFANPGLLGSLEAFRRGYAVPIERYGNDETAARLRRIVAAFVLRRLKSDPAIIDDLPPKNEMKVICTLTREQVTLYRAVVDEEMQHIEQAEGIERRGRVLALTTFLKQICNHPAHYLGEAGPLPRRSGKLERLGEMLEEAMAAGDKALVFTQYREMGDRLVHDLRARLAVETVFLHGGTPRKARDELVQRFQEEPNGPRVFVLSVKAGGTGLNLTAANHVFHFDRWWNPAVEDQATDRAYRIGQHRAVQVHKLVCAGTVEEKVDRMLEEKRALASKIVGTGERWLTELGNAELRELFSLAADAGAGPDDEESAP